MDVTLFIYLTIRWTPFFGALTCFFVLLTGRLQRDAVPASIRNILMIQFAAMGMNWLYVNTVYYLKEVEVVFMPTFYSLTLLVPVLFYHYVYQITRLRTDERFPLLHYLLPVLVFVLLTGGTIWLPELLVGQTLLPDGERRYLPILKMISLFRMLISLGYCVPGFLRIRRYRREILNYASNEQRVSLKWLRTLVILSVALVALPATTLLLGIGERPGQFLSPVMLFTVAVIVFQLISLTYHTLVGEYEMPAEGSRAELEVMDVPDEEGGCSPEESSAGRDESRQVYRDLLEECMRTRACFLKPDLRITELVLLMGTNRTYLSTFINEEYGVNFCGFVNRYRLAEFDRLRADETNQRYTHAELAMRSGFPSYRSYLRVKASQGEAEK